MNDLLPGLVRLLPFAGVLLATFVAAFFSGTETGAYRLNRVRLRLAQSQGRAGARALVRLLADMPGLICVTLIGHNLAVYAATVVVTGLWESGRGGQASVYAEILAMVSLAPVLYVFAEVLPKNIFNAEADRLMYPAARPLWLSSVLFRATGLVALLKAISRAWVWLRRRWERAGPPSDPFPARARLRSLVGDVAAEGLVTSYQNELVEKILDLRDVRVADAMTPAGRAVTIRMNASAAEFRRLVESCPFSNLPVLDPTTGDAVGVLKVHDVLRELGPQEEFDLTRFTRLALDLEASLSVAQALLAMQSARLPMGFVRDAEGKFLGLVTLKDLVEEIVGELEAW